MRSFLSQVGRLSEAVGRLADRRGDLHLALLLIVPAAMLYGGTILAWHLAVGEGMIDIMGMSDIGVYRYRGDLLLNGEVPYLDFYSESPPLMMYALAIPQALGGSLIAYASFLSAIAILTGVTTFLLLRGGDRRMAFTASAFIIYNPAMLVTAAVFVQDEVVVTLAYLLPVILLMQGKEAASLISAALGAMVKLFSAVLIPIGLMRGGARKAMVATLVMVAVALPFLVLAGDRFLRFPEYYLEQAGNFDYSVGISAWKFLADLGLEVPGWLLSVTMVGSLCLAYHVIWKRGADPLVAGLVLIIPFMVLFPKIIKSYILVPVALLSLLGARDERYLWYGVAVFALGYLASAFVTPKAGSPLLPNEGGWPVVPLALVIVMDLLLLRAAMGVLRAEG
jgi:hypothetical protein